MQDPGPPDNRPGGVSLLSRTRIAIDEASINSLLNRHWTTSTSRETTARAAK
jgi:hypothetical protein